MTIIEYGSLTCPHCAHFDNTAFPELKKRYIDTGKVRYIFREFALNPLDAGAIMLAQMHRQGQILSPSSRPLCQAAGMGGQKPLEPLLAIAKQAGFSKESFDACLKNQKLLDQIEGAAQPRREEIRRQLDTDFFYQRKNARAAPCRSRKWRRKLSPISMQNKDFLLEPAGRSAAVRADRLPPLEGERSGKAARAISVALGAPGQFILSHRCGTPRPHVLGREPWMSLSGCALAGVAAPHTSGRRDR